MSKKWYNVFVSVAGEGEGAPGTDAPDPATQSRDMSSAAQVAEIAASLKAPTFNQPVADPTSFAQIYEAAGVRRPAHGFDIFKIEELLRSEHIRTLPAGIKRSSVLLALDAAGVKLQEIIEDAVRRDKALDTFEMVQQRALEELEARKAEENKKLQAEADRILNELRVKIQSNNDEVGSERERMQTWRLKKQQEERRIADAVAPFVSENPVTTSPQAAPPPGGEKSGS